MPTNNGIGTSDYTREKHAAVAKIIEWHTQVTNHIIHRHSFANPPYIYIDMTAGTGEFSGQDTAPVCVQKSASKLGMECRSFLFEKTERTFLDLQERTMGFSGVNLFNCEFQSYLEAHHHLYHARDKKFGLAYYDPTTYTDFMPHMRFFGWYFSQPKYKLIDVMINVNATAIKRMRKQGCIDFSLGDAIAKVWPTAKKNGLIREPSGAWQFSLLFFTNWANPSEWKKQRLHRLDSPTGREILRRLDLTRDELKKAIENDPKRERQLTMQFKG